MEGAGTRWASREHKKVNCHSCHEQSIAESARQVITFVVRRPERVGKHAEGPTARCASCHTSGDPSWKQVAATAGHGVHAEGKKIDCVTCHSTAIHRLKPAEQAGPKCNAAQAGGAAGGPPPPRPGTPHLPQTPRQGEAHRELHLVPHRTEAGDPRPGDAKPDALHDLPPAALLEDAVTP